MALKTNYINGDVFGAGDINNTNSYILGNTYTNIAVSGTPTALGSYNTWDTKQAYGYKLDITITGLTVNSLIVNLVMTDTIAEKCAVCKTTSANTLTLYFKNATTISGTIFRLDTRETV